MAEVKSWPLIGSTVTDFLEREGRPQLGSIHLPNTVQRTMRMPKCDIPPLSKDEQF
jgi:hypothetical protein